MQQTRPRLESSHVNTEYVRKEEEEEEEEKEEERKEELAVCKKNKNPTQRMWGKRQTKQNTLL